MLLRIRYKSKVCDGKRLIIQYIKHSPIRNQNHASLSFYLFLSLYKSSISPLLSLFVSTNSPKPMTKLMDLPDCTYPKESATLITPSSPTPTHTLPLSNLDDQPFLRFSIRYLHLYKRSPCVESMKLSLSRVLVAYYPLAGRLRPSGGGEDHGAKLEVDCKGKGPSLLRATWDSLLGSFWNILEGPTCLGGSCSSGWRVSHSGVMSLPL